MSLVMSLAGGVQIINPIIIIDAIFEDYFFLGKEISILIKERLC
jgi:hypothetical protein